ncbi:CAP Gly-rich domain-containing protein [Sporodiniella umbellata]|nr:CAP Gly-rich domain-containing protein [Sporodiniella umbellata]
MFRKAKKLSQRLGLKKENCTNQAVRPVVESEIIKEDIIKEDTPKNDLDFLLTMETQARTDAMAKRESFKKEPVVSNRPTTIKFELPVTPPRSRSPTRLTYPRARPYRSLPEDGLVLNEKRKKRPSWRQFFSEESDSEPEAYVTMGAYVKLKRRPLPTFGYVQFIGGVDFGKGEWVGVELDHRVGNCDGSVDGTRYFKTDQHRGIFCKRHDLEAQ